MNKPSDKLIGIMSDPCPDLLTGLFAIIKSGNGFVPIDPIQPNERLCFILDDCQITILLTQDKHLSKAIEIYEKSACLQKIVCLDKITQAVPDSVTIYDSDNYLLEQPIEEKSAVKPEQPVYVIYTSGTTGVPKGVPISHQNLLPLLDWSREYFKFDEQTKALQNLNYAFDFGVFELLTTLLFGGTLHIRDKEAQLDAPGFVDYVNKHEINTIHSTPSFFRHIASHGQKIESLKILHLGGELLTWDMVNVFFGIVNDECLMYNGYGPTEATINCAIFTLGNKTTWKEMNSESVPIGKPSANNRLYILDKNAQPVPLGISGELHVGGVALTRSYLNRPDLTAEKFISNPFTENPNDRLYKTGDLARYLADGNIECLDRIDNQIKIRGFRIEPGEIEAVLSQHSDVQQAAVITQEDKSGLQRIVAYLVSDLMPDRIPYKTDCLVQLEETNAAFHTIDICSGGICVQGETSNVESGQELQIRLQSPINAAFVWLKAEVRWKRGAEIGLLFKPTPEERSVINQNISYILEKTGVVKMLQRTLTNRLRKYLKDKLPDYMVPSAFVLVSALPLTSNGKLDRRALSQLSVTSQPADENFIAPRTSDEELLADIWVSLLGVKRISIHDNFFELGGHSLLATQVMSRCRDSFGVELPLRALFDTPTIAGLNSYIQTARKQAARPAITPLDRSQPLQLLQLSFAQQRLWFLNQLEGESATYNISAAVRIEGELNLQALEQSLQTLVQRHDSLHTCFPMQNGLPVVQTSVPSFQLDRVDLSDLSEAEQKSEVSRRLQAEAATPFDLATGPLFRTQLLCLGKVSYVLQVNMHHIISDGWSMGVFVREWRILYATVLQGKKSSLPPLPIQYVDFAHWQRQWLTGELLEKQVKYWKQQLGGVPALLELPTDNPRPPTQSYQGASLSFSLSPELTTQVKQLCQQTNTTLFMTLWSAFAILLSRYSGQSDIVIGSPIANRTHSEMESLIGFFVNTLVLRLDLAENLFFEDVLQQARQVALEAYAHQDIPFEQLVGALQPERNLSHSPLFQVMFVLQNADLPDLELAGLSVTLLELESVTTKFDLTLELTETALGLSGKLEYNTDLFERTAIKRLSDHLQVLLTGIVENPKTPIHELPLLTKAEQQQLSAWNDTAADYPQDLCIHQLFEAQVENTPEAVAVAFENQQLTYRELNTQANQLAHYLQTLGVKPEVLVGICVERSIEMVIGVLGILKAGGAYVPLDPAYPAARLAFILEDAQMPVLLSQKSLKEGLPETQAQVVCLDVEAETLSQYRFENPVSRVGSENLAYVIYTSGSTGNPKGVTIEHRNVIALLEWSKTIFTPEQISGALLSTSLNFDVSVFELFVPLTRGGRIIVVENILSLAALSEKAGVIMVNTVPSAMKELIKVNDIPGSVQIINLAGEPCSLQLVQELYQISSLRQVFNIYGPTEDTVYSTFTLLSRSPHEKLTIGRPISNTQACILDRKLQLVPVGVSGELHLGGAGIARGYLNRPELTAEKFISNPFSDDLNSRLYKTGDLVRYLPDGNIEYLGRIDNQVKIRGFRIELGEIEAVLAQHPDVQENAVIVHDASKTDKRLVAYFVPCQGQLIENTALRSFLSERLPNYMIPSAFVTLESLPLTPNGKINRRALSQLSVSNYQLSEKTFVAPRTSDEKLLAEIWNEALGVERTGIHDNFFELGGHSLLAVSLLAQIERQFNTHLPLAALFQGATVAELAKLLSPAADASSQWSPLVAIQPLKQPFFCLPGAGGNVLYLHQLARHLGAEQPFYALQAVGLDGETAPDARIEDMAARYIKEIQRVQKHGPYLLGGHSFGSWIGLEMAKQLQQQGEEVMRLAIFDTTVPFNQAIGRDWDEGQWITDIAHIAGRLLGIDLGISYAQLQQRSFSEQLGYLHEKLEQNGWLISIKQLQALVKIFKANNQTHYVARDIPAVPISLFKAQDLAPESQASAQMERFSQHLKQEDAWGWRQYAKGEVDIHVVPGDHHTMMSQPHVQVLAEKLKSCLERSGM